MNYELEIAALSSKLDVKIAATQMGVAMAGMNRSWIEKVGIANPD